MAGRIWVALGGLAVLAACNTSVPVSNPGVGFGDYAAYELDRAQREAALTGGTAPGGNPLVFPGATAAAPAPGAVPLGTLPSPSGISTTDLAAAGIGGPAVSPDIGGTGAPLGAPLPSPLLNGGAVAPAPGVGLADPLRTAGVQATPGNAAVVIASSGISDEQDFGAVTERESIEDAAARRAQQQAAYTVIQPTALPDQPQNTGPDIVAYALSAPNRLGQSFYSRFILSGQGRFQRNCSEYRSPDEAQRDFLARGGPDRDPRGIDPDGDGFACGWDPAPFLAAVGR